MSTFLYAHYALRFIRCLGQDTAPLTNKCEPPAFFAPLDLLAGIEKAKDGGEDLVRYQTFLDILRISRNRKMAALQRAKELTRRGLKRWQANGLVRRTCVWLVPPFRV